MRWETVNQTLGKNNPCIIDYCITNPNADITNPNIINLCIKRPLSVH